MNVIQSLAQLSQPILSFPLIRRIRRNHAYEHATVHMLNQKKIQLSGRSSEHGFVLYGNVPTDMVESAANEALERMRKGEKQLAIHPNCGTNLITGAFLTALVGAIGFGGKSRKQIQDRFSLVMMGMMIAAIVSQPLGMELQRHFTTEGDPGDLELLDIERSESKLPFGNKSFVAHRITTRKG